MTEYEIRVPQLDKQFTLDIEYNETMKSQTNRTFANASPFAEGGVLVQKKFCSITGKEVDNSMVTHKVVKLGKKNQILVPIERLKDIEDNIEKSATEIKINAVLKKADVSLPVERVDGCRYIKPAKKRARDYLEMKELGKTHIFIGEAVFKSNSYEVAITTQDNTLVCVKFGAQNRMREKPDDQGLAGVEVNPDLIKLEREILDKSVTKSYDFTKFEDIRQEQVDELIEKLAFGEELPPIVEKSEAKEIAKDDTSEMERLKALLSKGTAEASA